MFWSHSSHAFSQGSRKRSTSLTDKVCRALPSRPCSENRSIGACSQAGIRIYFLKLRRRRRGHVCSWHQVTSRTVAGSHEADVTAMRLARWRGPISRGATPMRRILGIRGFIQQGFNSGRRIQKDPSSGTKSKRAAP